MDNITVLTEELINNHMEKLFYFCLKKTGDSYEAEDLTSDILLNILTALKRGIIPDNLNAYVWKIARNRYSVWAARKHRRAELTEISDINDLELCGDEAEPIESLIKSEDEALLRRELAFISSDYRKIIVAYYLENRRTADIAKSLGLPKGTVESKLHRARQKLKEGMNMAREFGKRSYNPENITFVNNCSSFGKSGQPWSILSHLLYKNIFLEAYNNPSTAEELALGLGIALPYMEDELKYLCDQTFLIKDNGRYETAFPIVSKETQKAIHDLNASSVKELTSLFEKYIDTFNASCIRRGLSWYGDFVDYETAKWVLLIREYDHIVWSANKYPKEPHTKRPDKGEWDITGYETTDFTEPSFIGQHGMGNFTYDFSQYKFQWNDLQRNHPSMLSEAEVDCFNAVCGGNTENCDADILSALERYGYIRKNGDGYELSIAVLPKDKNDIFFAGLTETELQTMRECHTKITAIITDMESKAETILRRDMPPKVLENPRQFADALGSVFRRGYVFEQAIADGWLKYDENTPKSVGAYIIK